MKGTRVMQPAAQDPWPAHGQNRNVPKIVPSAGLDGFKLRGGAKDRNAHFRLANLTCPNHAKVLILRAKQSLRQKVAASSPDCPPTSCAGDRRRTVRQPSFGLRMSHERRPDREKLCQLCPAEYCIHCIPPPIPIRVDEYGVFTQSAGPLAATIFFI